MANTILTPTAVTRACLAVLHQKLNFIGNINRQYDDSFAVEGAKIGSALKIRLPNEYTVSSGATLSVQDTAETSTTLNVTTQKQVGLRFTANELTLSIQDFTERFIEPAMSVLAANIEADALSMVNDIYQTVDNSNTSITMATVLLGRKKLVDALAPNDGRRRALLNTQDNADLVNALKALFNDTTEIAEQYREGMMGRTGGFDFYENTLLPTQTSGTTSATNGYAVNTSITVSATTPTSSIDVLCSSTQGSFVVGDVFTISGLNRVHPETKVDTGVVQQFTVTTAVAAGQSATSITFSPPIYMSGGRQNVVATAITTKNITKIGNSSYVYRPSLVFHRDAFTFATADLIMPKGVHFAGREVQDGISLRLVQQYDINYDYIPCRVDVLYGYKTIRAQLAARMLSN